MTAPHQNPDQSFEAHQQEVADWMGYPSVQALNAHHDSLHVALCRWLGVESQSMRVAAGEALTIEESTLAALEEDAVMHLQRFMAHAGKGVPK